MVQAHAGGLAALLKYPQQFQPRDRAARRCVCDFERLVVQPDKLPVLEYHRGVQPAVDFRVRVPDPFARDAAERDAEAVCCVRRILLDNDDVVRRVTALHQAREVEAGRTAADDRNFHPSCSVLDRMRRAAAARRLKILTG